MENKTAMEIINSRYQEALEDKNCEYTGVSINLNIIERNVVRFTDEEITTIVLEYQETQDEILFQALYENYYYLVRYLSKRYEHAYSGLRRGYKADEDLLQEFVIILHKCANRFKKMKDGHYFKAYLIGELRNHFILTALNKYFDVVKIPTKEYKLYRKMIKENDKAGLASDLGMAKKAKNDQFLDLENPELVMCEDLSSDESFNILFSDEGRVLNILRHVLKDEDKVVTFCLANGIFTNKKYSLTEISKYLNVTVSAISKRVTKARIKLSKSKEIKELAKEFGFTL